MRKQCNCLRKNTPAQNTVGADESTLIMSPPRFFHRPLKEKYGNKIQTKVMYFQKPRCGMVAQNENKTETSFSDLGRQNL